MDQPINNFASFYTQAMRDRSRKIKRGKYRGQMRGFTAKDLKSRDGMVHYKQPGQCDDPNRYQPAG